jgi:hypothetical protein
MLANQVKQERCTKRMRGKKIAYTARSTSAAPRTSASRWSAGGGGGTP